METRMGLVLYALAMIVVVVGVDVFFLRHQFAERLFVNIGIVLIFGTIYVGITRRP